MNSTERAELAAEALRNDADRRVRAAVAGAAELMADTTVKDKRTGALRIVGLLAEAAELRAAADELVNGSEPAPAPLPDLDAALAVAHAEATGEAVTDPVPAPEGSPNGAGAPIMGATSEDDPADHEVETVLE